MTYARFNPGRLWPDGTTDERCDVGIYAGDAGIVCWGCLLTSGSTDTVCRSMSEIRQHLDEHRAAGHAVPDIVYQRIEADRVENERDYGA